jgi:hypothetical protein
MCCLHGTHCHAPPPDCIISLTREYNSAGGQVCRAFAAVSRDDSLWRRLGHPSWEEHHVTAYASFAYHSDAHTSIDRFSCVCTVAVWLAG